MLGAHRREVGIRIRDDAGAHRPVELFEGIRFHRLLGHGCPSVPDTRVRSNVAGVEYRSRSVALGNRVASKAVHYGAYPVVALAATVMLETGERGSLSQAADGIQAHFHVSDFWIGALPTVDDLDRRPRLDPVRPSRRPHAAHVPARGCHGGVDARDGPQRPRSHVHLPVPHPTRHGRGRGERTRVHLAAVGLLPGQRTGEADRALQLGRAGRLRARPRPRRCVRRQLGLARCVLDVDPLRDRNGVDAAASTGAGTG